MCTKSVIYEQSCCFANLNLFNLFAFSLPLTSSLFKLNITIIIIIIVSINSYHCLIIITVILYFVVDAQS